MKSIEKDILQQTSISVKNLFAGTKTARSKAPVKWITSWCFVGTERLPQRILSHDALYVNENMPYADLFGHVHNSPIIKDYSKKHYCVSVERINYSPIDFEEIKATILRLSSAK